MQLAAVRVVDPVAALAVKWAEAVAATNEAPQRRDLEREARGLLRELLTTPAASTAGLMFKACVAEMAAKESPAVHDWLRPFLADVALHLTSRAAHAERIECANLVRYCRGCGIDI